MLIGRAGPALTSISTADADHVSVRGHDLATELMGTLTFTQYFFLLLTGRQPTKEQTFFLDLLLVAIAEHGLVPTNQVARMTYAAEPSSLQGAVAAGILGCGTIVLGTADLCGHFLVEAAGRVGSAGGDAGPVLDALVAEYRARNEKVPGFGHPIHKKTDPRTERIFELAAERKMAGAHVALAIQTKEAVARASGRSLVMNVSMAIAAILLDLDFPPAMIKAIPILGRTASLLAHLAEEQKRPIGFLMAAAASDAIGFDVENDSNV